MTRIYIAMEDANAGESWQKLVMAWPERYYKQHVQGIVAIG
jgi:hypothetical protein